MCVVISRRRKKKKNVSQVKSAQLQSSGELSPSSPFHWLISHSKLRRWIFQTRQIWIKTSWLFHCCTVPPRMILGAFSQSQREPHNSWFKNGGGKSRERKANTRAVSQCGKLIGSISLVKMNEEINSPYVSSESPPLAPGKLADDKLTVGILFLPPTETCRQYLQHHPACLKPFTGFVYISIYWIGDVSSSGSLITRKENPFLRVF